MQKLARVRNVVVLGTVLGLVVGCATGVDRTIRTPYNSSEMASYAGTGSATITGQAFSRTRGGDVKIPAGNTIYLVPLTNYTREVLDKYYASAIGDSNTAHLKPYIRLSTIDAQGNFVFLNVPAGVYRATTVHTWMAGNDTTGGEINGDVSVKSGETVRVFVK